MSVLGKSLIIGVQYLTGFVVVALVQQLAGLPFWALQAGAVLWFVVSVYRLAKVKCPHCGADPYRGPRRYNPFAPKCRNCGASVALRAPAA
jgi:hypothetical protein